MKPWYRKKKVWASIIGALLVILTVFLAPAEVETAKVIAAAILEAAVSLGFVFAESSIDKAGVKVNMEASIAGLTNALPHLSHIIHEQIMEVEKIKTGFVPKENNKPPDQL